MKWGELISILQDVISDMLRDTLNSVLPSVPPPVPAGQGFDTHFNEYVPLGAAPLSFEQPSPLMTFPGLNVQQPAPIIYQGPPLYNQNIMHSQQVRY